MHLGHARTHLFLWLYARANDLNIVMRFDDSDQTRCKREFVDDFLRAHEALGLDFDKGPVFQSQRSPLYEKAYRQLVDQGYIYQCACSRADIVAQRPPFIEDVGYVYPGTCRQLKLATQSDEGILRAARFKLADAPLSFEDLLQGQCTYDYTGDFIVRSKDGFWSYQLASVVDDIDLAISHVIRATDLLPTSAMQLPLFKALGGSIPTFIHLNPVVDREGHKLSKRKLSKRRLSRHKLSKNNGTFSVRELLKNVTPEVLIGRLAHSLDLRDDAGPCALNELVGTLSLDKIATKPVTLDVADITN